MLHFSTLHTRYSRDPDTDADTASKSMLGAVQKAWLKSALVASEAKWKIVFGTVSANKSARPTNIDHWMTSGTTEAAEMKAFLVLRNGLEQETIMISGDLHTGGGVDDGSNIGWGFPELGIAYTNLAMGNANNVGTWSEGAITGVGNPGYRNLMVTSDTLVLEAKNAAGSVIHTLTLVCNSTWLCDGWFPHLWSTF